MQIIFFNGPSNGLMSATITCSDGHIQLNKIPASHTSATEAAVRSLADKAPALPPTREHILEYFGKSKLWTREETGNDLPLFNWTEPSEEEPEAAETVVAEPTEEEKAKAEAKAAKEAEEAAAAQKAADEKLAAEAEAAKAAEAERAAEAKRAKAEAKAAKGAK